MKNLSIAKRSDILSLATITFVLLLLCSFIFAPSGVAYADWQDGYTQYINSLPSTDNKDWYFGESYLNLDGALTIINDFLRDPNFDKETLKNDPIVIAVIDSGIGYAYKTSGSTEVAVNPENVYDSGVSYKLHEIFDDVLLKDGDGNYIYKNFADKVKIDGSGLIDKTITAVTDSGNIAKDLVDNTSNDHGTHVTGIVALLIHQLGLEEYIKILPIKANTTLSNKKSGEYLAGYNSSIIESALEFAYENGADVVNLSLTANSSNKTSYDFDRADDMVLVAAAGNQGKNTDGYPAAHPNVLGVMNYKMTSNGKAVLADSSTYGIWYDVAAPGTDIISSINGDEYGTLTGTSMSTPITAVASALAYFRFRGYNNYGLDVELTPDIIRAMIPYGAQNGSNSRLEYEQYPMLNLTDILSYNFYGDATFINSVVGAEESVDILSDAQESYIVGKDSEITLYAMPTPSTMKYDYDVKWWYVFGGEEYLFAEDWYAHFEVPNYVGDYTIKCVIYDKYGNEYMVVEEQVAFEVVYQQIEDLCIFVTENDTYSYTYSIKSDYLDPSITIQSIEWYVNGQLAHTGNNFDFAVEDGAEDIPYIITVKVNGEEVIDYKVVEYESEYSDAWLMLFVIYALAFAGIAVATEYIWIVMIAFYVAYAVIGVIVLSIVFAVLKKKEQKK